MRVKTLIQATTDYARRWCRDPLLARVSFEGTTHSKEGRPEHESNRAPEDPSTPGDDGAEAGKTPGDKGAEATTPGDDEGSSGATTCGSWPRSNAKASAASSSGGTVLAAAPRVLSPIHSTSLSEAVQEEALQRRVRKGQHSRTMPRFRRFVFQEWLNKRQVVLPPHLMQCSCSRLPGGISLAEVIIRADRPDEPSTTAQLRMTMTFSLAVPPDGGASLSSSVPQGEDPCVSAARSGRRREEESRKDGGSDPSTPSSDGHPKGAPDDEDPPAPPPPPPPSSKPSFSSSRCFPWVRWTSMAALLI